MNRIKTILTAISIIMASGFIQSCSDFDDSDNGQIAVVTVRQAQDNVELRLDKSTLLMPINLKKSPFGDKAVRALITYSPVETTSTTSGIIPVQVNWMEGITTKDPVVSYSEPDLEKYGKDPLEIIKDWVTIAEDGFLTLRVRTIFNDRESKHELNLVKVDNPENPYEFELYHNANGDTSGSYGDGLIAFDLNGVYDEDISGKKITVIWNSFNGRKSYEFTMDAAPEYTNAAVK